MITSYDFVNVFGTFLSTLGVWDKVFVDTQIFVITQCGIGRKKPPCQNQLDPFSRFDTIPACDGLSHDDNYHAIVASRGKIVINYKQVVQIILIF